MKFKKTLLAAAFAAASMNAAAVVDMDASPEVPLVYSDELKGTLDANGRIEVTQKGNNTDISVDVGFVIAKDAVRYLRFDLTGATFEGTPDITVDNKTDCSTTQTVASPAQGGDDESFAIFVVTAAEPIAVGCDVVVNTAKNDIDPTVSSTVTFGLYETVSNAANQSLPLYTKTAQFASFVSSADYSAVVEGAEVVATVASGFTSFDNSANANIANGTLANLAFLDADDVIKTAASTVAGDTAAASDYITAAQTITVTGDMSVGTFTSQSGNDCTGGTIACTKATDNGSCTIASTATEADQYICVQLSGITAGTSLAKGTYSIGFATDTAMDSASAGEVKYDTTTVNVPYVTTYEGYNQRLFIDNRGTTAAYYTTSFTTENGVTATAGTAATGTLAAGEIATVKISDLVTFAGGTRGMATMEVEAQSANLKVTTQIVDLGTGMTDTIVLN